MTEYQRNKNIEAAWQMARYFLRLYGSVSPFTVLHDDNGQIFGLPPFRNEQDKIRHAAMLADAVLSFNAEFVLMLGEAWYATVQGEPTVRPGDLPGRIEVLLLQWKQRDGSEGTEIRRIERGGKFATVGARIPFPQGAKAPDSFNKYFDGLFETKH